mgnify:CR=1 FL=1
MQARGARRRGSPPSGESEGCQNFSRSDLRFANETPSENQTDSKGGPVIHAPRKSREIPELCPTRARFHLSACDVSLEFPDDVTNPIRLSLANQTSSSSRILRLCSSHCLRYSLLPPPLAPRDAFTAASSAAASSDSTTMRSRASKPRRPSSSFQNTF